MKNLRTKLAVLALTLLCTTGCRVKPISRESETFLGLPLAWMGVAPSWDVDRGHVEIEGPGPLRDTPWLEFFIGFPLMPLFLPSWEDERERQVGESWWSHRVSGNSEGAVD